MSNRSRRARIVRWCRYHPRATGIGALVLVALIVIGALTDPPKDTTKDTAQRDSSTSASVPSADPSTPANSSSEPAGSSSTSPSPARLSAAPADHAQRSGTLAVDVLDTLAVKGRAAKTGYSRAQFGTAWTDDNDNPLAGNGCSTREDVLRRDLTTVTPSTGCTVATGTLHDPYTDRTITFRHGASTSSKVQIDHVVALSDSWQKGAQRYDARTRTDLANDPLNLLAVDGPTNGAKGDGDAATWLPPNTAYRCSYVARQIAVKARYRLWMTVAEHDAAARVLGRCPGQTVPTEPGRAHLTIKPKPAPKPRTTTRPPPAPVTSEPPTNVYYQNCDAVRAAGAAPLHSGQPGYDSHLDRDGDGVACE